MLQRLDPDVLEQDRERFTQIQGHEPFTAGEIDGVCEELNCPGEQIFLVWDPDRFCVLGAAHGYDDAVAVAELFDDVVIRPFLTGVPATEPEPDDVENG